MAIIKKENKREYEADVKHIKREIDKLHILMLDMTKYPHLIDGVVSIMNKLEKFKGSLK